MTICIVQAASSPFVERLLKKGYEVLYLTEPVDEYCMEALPEYEGQLVDMYCSLEPPIENPIFTKDISISLKANTFLTSN